MLGGTKFCLEFPRLQNFRNLRNLAFATLFIVTHLQLSVCLQLFVSRSCNKFLFFLNIQLMVTNDINYPCLPTYHTSRTSGSGALYPFKALGPHAHCSFKHSWVEHLRATSTVHYHIHQGLSNYHGGSSHILRHYGFIYSLLCHPRR